MMALDTNVLVRFLVRDDERQAQQVYRLFKQAEEKGEVLFVPLLIVLETIWVLQSVYDVADATILATLGDLLLMTVLKFEQAPVIQSVVAGRHGLNLDLADSLIAYSAEHCNCAGVYTFDKKAAKFSYFKLLGEHQT